MWFKGLGNCEWLRNYISTIEETLISYCELVKIIWISYLFRMKAKPGTLMQLRSNFMVNAFYSKSIDKVLQPDQSPQTAHFHLVSLMKKGVFKWLVAHILYLTIPNCSINININHFSMNLKSSTVHFSLSTSRWFISFH